MAQQAKTPCSPYLLKERRGLREACRQISMAHGAARPPCGPCPLADLCGPPAWPLLAARARLTRAILVDLRGKPVRRRTTEAA
ncbi:MAG: hypothetical protein OEM59_04895 [Rhodospirillales bacterium]|nr:hypothetical protein [Rhodospirillales bacterium]